LIDVGWGLGPLSRVYRAQSLKSLGRDEEAAAEYSRVAADWADAEPECAERVAEAINPP
jgi:hypothetical protein